MKAKLPLNIDQLRSGNVDFRDFYDTLRLYGEIIKIFEINLVTHEKHFKFRDNYFSVGMHKGEVTKIGTTYKNKPDFELHIPRVTY